jgi:hypothetical protein
MRKDAPPRSPNFFIVGAAKSGTTSLYHYLDQHPDVYMSPIKEPHYFCKDIRCADFDTSYQKNVCLDVKKYLGGQTLEKKHIAFIEDQEEYLQLYRDVTNQKAIGEISNGYLYSTVAAENIYQFNHDAMIVMVLRNPIERAFSHWAMDLRGNDVYRKSFVGAIEDDLAKKEKGWGKNHLYIELGLYYEQVKRYLEVFPEKHILILRYDDLKCNSQSFVTELFDFLEIAHLDIDTNKRYNSASIPLYPKFTSLIKQIRLNHLATKMLPKTWKNNITKAMSNNENLPKLSKNDIDAIKKYFIDDINKLEKLINWDLFAWLQ